MNEAKMQDLILRALFDSPNREAILLPTMFMPPILLSNIFKVGLNAKSKGLTSAPNRRMGGWHLKLTDAGIAYCQATPVVPAKKPGLK